MSSSTNFTAYCRCWLFEFKRHELWFICVHVDAIASCFRLQLRFDLSRCKKVSKLGDRSRGWSKGSFSIATTPRYREGATPFPLSLILTLYYWMLSKDVSSTIFKFLVWLDLGLNPGLTGHWWTVYPLGQRAVYIKESTLISKPKLPIKHFDGRTKNSMTLSIAKVRYHTLPLSVPSVWH